MSDEEVTAAASKAAWDAGDYKAASRILSRLKELNPELILVQRGDGVVCKRGEQDVKTKDYALEPLE